MAKKKSSKKSFRIKSNPKNDNLIKDIVRKASIFNQLISY